MERLFEIEPAREVEWQVDAFFAPLYATIPNKHHAMLESLERHMINALMLALLSEPIEPLPIDPNTWPSGSGKRLATYLQDEQRRKAACDVKSWKTS